MLEGTLEQPIYGISTLADNRKTREARLQVNFKSDKLKGLTSRPPSIFEGSLSTRWQGNYSQKEIYYEENDIECNAKLLADNTLIGYCRLIVRNGSGESEYVIDRSTIGSYCYNTDIKDLELYYVNGDIIVLNKNKQVKMLNKKDEDATTGDRRIPAVAVINFLEALNYQERVEITIKAKDKLTNEIGIVSAIITLGAADATGEPVFIPSYTYTDSLGTYTIPDYTEKSPDGMRSTYGIVNAMQALILNFIRTGEATNANFLKERLGVSVAGSSLIIELREAINGQPMIAKDAEIEIQVIAGEGSTGFKVTNYEAQDVDGLPLYTKENHTLKITPSKNKADGTYYVRAERIEDVVAGNYGVIGNNNTTYAYKVKWVQTRAPDALYEIDKTTMPLVVVNGGSLSTIDWGVRTTGDDETVPLPAFVEYKISGISYYQNRLVIISDNYVQFSETDDILMFFRSSAIQLLVTDPFYVTSSLIGTSKILEVIPHNKDLLFFTKDKQLKISGEQALTPELTSLRVSTSYSLKTSKVKPVSIGNAVYFITDYGDSCGLFRYFAEENTNADKAEDLSSNVIGYIKGNPDLMSVSPNLSMIVLKTDNADNELYVYQEMIGGEGERIDTWSKWVFGEQLKIIGMYFKDEELILEMYNENKDIIGLEETYKVKMNIYNRLYNTEEVYMDNMEIFDFNGKNYNPEGVVYSNIEIGRQIRQLEVNHTVYRKIQEDTEIVLTSLDIEEKYQETKIVNIEKVGYNYKLTFENEITPTKDSIRLFIGNRIVRKYTPNRPFLKDDYGRIVISDDVRVIRYVVSVEDTGYVRLMGESEEYETIEQDYDSYVLNEYNLFDNNPKIFSAQLQFSYNMSANRSTFSIYSDKIYPLTVSQIVWEGNITRRNQRA